MADILDIVEYRIQRQLDAHWDCDTLRLWERYDEIVEDLDGFPGWLVLKVMTACRKRLQGKDTLQ